MKSKKYFSTIILEKLAELGELSLEAMFPRNRAESAIWRKVLGLSQGYEFSRQTFSTTLARLKKQGLVKGASAKRKFLWSITNKGHAKLMSSRVLIPEEIDGIPRLVVYDVPESNRRKRDWLRKDLVACGYKQLQKSVWLGYRPLPAGFAELIDELKLRRKIHILGIDIDKEGTLEEV
jgi:phenylacetic acid degradation operon negative regulatory protein